MAKDPAFLFMSKDWIEGTAEMMPEEKGVFIDLLCHQHQKGDLPTDTMRLARMVALSHEEFIRIWDTVGTKFERNGERLVNRKLSECMSERSEKGHRNFIIGSFSALLRKHDLSQKEHKQLRQDFNVNDFLAYDKQNASERLSEWFHERLKSIGNGNGNKNKSITVEEYIESNKEELTNIFITHEKLKKSAISWLAYKWKRKERYTEVGWAALMVKRAIETSEDFIISKIAETIAAEAHQDYFYPSTRAEWQRGNSGQKNGQKQPSKMDDTNDVFSKLLNENQYDTSKQIGH